MENYLNEYLSSPIRGGDHVNVPNKYVAMTLIQMQEFEDPYDEDTAFVEGTIFPSLNKPFLGGK